MPQAHGPYRTVEERCAACVMRDGEEQEDPCMNERALERFQEVVGRDCPYVDLEPSNATLTDVVGFALDERVRPLLEGAFRDATEDLTRDERQVLRARLARALGSPRVNDALYPELSKRRSATPGQGR